MILKLTLIIIIIFIHAEVLTLNCCFIIASDFEM